MTVICWVLCSRRNWMFTRLVTSWILILTHRSLKILHVRWITLQELISTANSRHHSLHPAYGHNAFRPPKASERGTAGAGSLCNVCWAYKHNCHSIMLFIAPPSWHAAWNSQILLIGINYWHLPVHWCPELGMAQTGSLMVVCVLHNRSNTVQQQIFFYLPDKKKYKF